MKWKVVFLLLLARASFGQSTSPTPKVCDGLSVIAWEQDAVDVVESWQLFVSGTPRPTWPIAQVTPRPTPGQYEYPMVTMPPNGEPFWLVACNEDGCSDPSNVMACRAKKPKPKPPRWLIWWWR